MDTNEKSGRKWDFQDRSTPDLEAWHEFVNAVKVRFGRDALEICLAGYKEIEARWSRRDDQRPWSGGSLGN